MTGISPDVITHKLNVDPSFKPVKQKRRKFAPERNKIIDEEVQKLIDSGKVREVKYPDWCDVPTVGQQDVQRPTWRHNGGLHRRHASKIKEGGRPRRTPTTILRHIEEIRFAKPQKIYDVTTPPVQPKEGEVLQLYLAVSSTAVSAVLAHEDETQQLPIYYISKSLLEAETRYSSLEKLVLALVTAAKKLRHYFETHQIAVMTNYPIQSVMRRPELTGRMEKLTMALGSFDIKYQPRTAVKSQALADFVADFSPDLEKTADDEVKLINNVEEVWTLFVDGSANFRGAGLGVVLKSPQGDMIAQAICCDFKATNNEAEYEAVIAGLTLAEELEASGLNIFSDSQLIFNQINGDYEAKDLKMTLYLEKAKKLTSRFKPFSIKQVPRDLNTQGDALANLGSALRKSHFSTIPLVHLLSPAIEKDIPQDASLVLSTTNADSWTKPILDYLAHETLPDDKLKARKILFKASRYVILQGILFKRSANGMLMRCAEKTEWEGLLKQYHEGECGGHEGGRSLSTKIKRNGYYWPTMLKDAMRFGVPSKIICDNGSQFISDKTRAFCKTGNIELKTSTPRYPQANGQAESSNKTIIASPKKRLDDKNGRWAEELSSILWANRTTPRTATGQTPFSLVYGCEAILPPEVTLPSARYGLMTPEQNDVELGENLDNTEDFREAALIRMASQQQIVAKCFNKNVKIKVFKEGDWVLRKVFQNTKELNAGKLAPAWEGPYLVDKIVGKGAYTLVTKDGKSVPQSWNATHLKLYHF
ncbi:uncharacterized protein [Spinacia oleracea]|uniref:Uncharacterized protein n=1 Tax=Spinacia oleracea TaxID=3562 RepID=A0ABM3QXA5_SPIOL|nr:uncharacterized protein LOC130463009 [Spinacia oleracea]